MEIPADARRVSSTTLECRCDKEKVLRIENFDGTVAEKKEVEDFKLGETISAEKSAKRDIERAVRDKQRF